MLAHTNTQTTSGFVDLHLHIRREQQDAVHQALTQAGILYSFDLTEHEDEALPLDNVFPDLHSGSAIRGLRYREGLTQAQLAERIGVKRHHVSEMEHGRRSIGKEMAKRLATALKTDYKVFL